VNAPFAFVLHPLDPKSDVQRKFPALGRLLTERQIDLFSRFFPPVFLSQVDGAISAKTGREQKGFLLACPLTPRRMLELPPRVVYDKLAQTGRLAERLGARILGLGAFAKVVGDGGLSVARRLDIPVTTGNSYTVAIAVEAIRGAARVMDICLEEATAAVVGATGTIGSVCAELLAGDVGQLWLIARNRDRLEALRERCEGTGARVRVSTDLATLREADLVLTVTSAIEAIVEPAHLKSGAVVCDVARPRDVSRAVAAERDDVLVIEGGMVSVPGPVDFHFDFGFPPGMAYACMAETMALAMEGRFERFTLGKQISLEQVAEIAGIAEAHGFRLGGLRSFERAVTPKQIAHVRERADLARRRVSHGETRL
jgi:fatty aldehyde-generating acyl-ACP reductase